jgi:hypothetical protein
VVIDFAIVVVGVFIGIQVSNWNTARVENKLEQGYLVRLHEDFSHSLATFPRQRRLECPRSAGAADTLVASS